MKILVIIIVTVNFLINPMFAQQDSLINDSCKCNNEITINIIPIISEISVGDVEHQKFMLTYKHRMGNGAMRLQVNYIPEYSHYYLPAQFQYSNYEEYQDTANTFRSVYARNIQSYCVGGAIGYEWQNGKQWAERIIGFDISFSINFLDHNAKKSIWKLDTVKNNFIEDQILKESSMKTRVARIGINPFYGWKFQIEKQFLILVQFGADFGYYFGDVATIDSNYDFAEKPINNFNLSRYFLNELSVVFRF
ncbi:MAG: hypothetical protein ABIJ97_12545 [Bacteroidota bacterium]